jgi:predicted transcriptional regulator
MLHAGCRTRKYARLQGRYSLNLVMLQTKRATIYLDPQLHRALSIKAAETDQSISDLVNEAIRQSLIEDMEDLEDFKERADEPNLAFEDV